MMKKVVFFCALLCLSLQAQQESQQMQTAAPPRPYSYCPNTTSGFVYGEWLYWLPVTTDPMWWEYKNYSITAFGAGGGGGGPAPTVSVTSDKHIDTLTYDFTSGYRIGGGIRIGKDGMAKNVRPWQIEAIYTAFKTSKAGSNSGFVQTSPNNSLGGTSNVSGYLVPLLPSYTTATALDAMTESYTHASLNFKQVDVDFAWPIWLNADVILRLKTGPIFTWVESSWRSTWNTNTGSLDYFEATNLKWDWKGGGLVGGGDVYLPIGLGLAFVADANFGFLFGPMKEKEAYPSNPIDSITGTPSTYDYAERHFLSFQPKVSVSAMLDYIKTFRKNGAAHVAVGWEFNWWFYLNQFGQITSPAYYNSSAPNLINPQQMFNVTPGGLILQGLRVQAGLEY